MYPDVLLLRQKNMGVSSARNNGVMMASCEWIAFLDSDDEWHPDKISMQCKLHKQSPALKISYTDEKWVRNGKTVELPKKYQKPPQATFENSLDYCNIAPSSVLVEKAFFDSIGGFDESLEVCEEYDLWLRILAGENIGFIDKKLVTKYGGHSDQLSSLHWGMDRFRVRALEKLLAANPDHPAITKTLLEKYTLLLKGAQKYGRDEDAMHYRMRIAELL
jgi:glycosyltransferase involved in cell wall biosynthesis